MGGGGQQRWRFFVFFFSRREGRITECVGRKQSDWVWAQEPSLKEDGNARHVSTHWRH